MEPDPILESPAPTKVARTIKIEGVEYAYSINQVQEEEKLVLITLSEEKPHKNITFTYKASEKKLIKDIKLLSVCDNVEEMISELMDIFNNDEISVEKKDEKYFMKIKTSRPKKVALGKVPGAVIGAVVSGSVWLPDAPDSDSVESYLGYFHY